MIEAVSPLYEYVSPIQREIFADALRHNKIIAMASDPYFTFELDEFNTIEEYDLYIETKEYMDQYGPEWHGYQESDFCSSFGYQGPNWITGFSAREEGSNLTHFYDPKKNLFPAKIKSGKPHCPECGATVTEIRTCPYKPDIEITIPFKSRKQRTEYFVENIQLSSRYVERKVIVDNSFFDRFHDYNHNFDVDVHKKIDGPTSVIINPRLIVENSNDEKVIDSPRSRPLLKVKESKPCECGCNVTITDCRHGEILCPDCGLVLDKLFIITKEGV